MPSPLEFPFPQGHLTTACIPTLVSGHETVIVRSCLPECDGIKVLLAGQPSDNKETHKYHRVRYMPYQIGPHQLLRYLF